MSAAMDTQVSAEKLAVSGWIQKPFDVEEMLRLVAGYLPARRCGGVDARNSSDE
jgi:hypothetical protein